MFKCYELEEEGYVICSKCAVVGYDFKSCQASTKCCINCKMTHSTMSFFVRGFFAVGHFAINKNVSFG